MNQEARGDQLLVLLRELDPVDAAELERELGEAELRERLTRSIALGDSTATGPPGDRGRRPRLAVAAGVLAAAVATAIAIVLIGGRSVPSTGHPAYAAAAVRIAEDSPRMLITAPGWQIISANGFSADEGELIFGNSAYELEYDGAHEIQLTWFPQSQRAARLGGWAGPGVEHRRIDVRGRQADLFISPVGAGEDDHLIAFLHADRGSYVEIRGTFASERTFLDLLDSLRAVDVQTWLGAMPPDVIKLADRAAVVDQMLEGAPIPPGFDRHELTTGAEVSDVYQLGMRVSGSLACGWLDAWSAATAAGDAQAAAQAERALAGAAQWPVLRQVEEMSHGASETILAFAGQVERGTLETDRLAPLLRKPDGTTVDMGPPYAVSLGCDSMVRRRAEPD